MRFWEGGRRPPVGLPSPACRSAHSSQPPTSPCADLTMFAASNAGGWAGDWLINQRRSGVAAGRKAVNTAGFWAAAAALMLMPGERRLARACACGLPETHAKSVRSCARRCQRMAAHAARARPPGRRRALAGRRHALHHTHTGLLRLLPRRLQRQPSGRRAQVCGGGHVSAPPLWLGDIFLQGRVCHAAALRLA